MEIALTVLTVFGLAVAVAVACAIFAVVILVVLERLTAGSVSV